MTSALILSLDFELFWGVLESKTAQNYGEQVRGVKQALPALLDLLDAYSVRATIATVGFLFFSNSQQLRAAWPSEKPMYRNPRLSSYEFPFDDSSLYFAPELVDRVVQQSRHELASHTFSHFYCAEPGASSEAFVEDLECMRAAVAKRGLELTSIVYPRNQIVGDCLALSASAGYKCYRGNQTSWLYRTSNRSLFGRVLRLADCYLNLSGHNFFVPHLCPAGSGMVNLPASAFLRPHRRGHGWLDPWQVRRITASLKQTARQGKYYHLWWHPHNFGTELAANLAMLRKILDCFQDLQKRYGMRSLTMKEAAAGV